MLPSAEHSAFPSVIISSLRLNLIGYDKIIELINDSIAFNKKLVINYVNAYSVILANKDENLTSALNNSDLVHPDGIGICLAARMLTKNKQLCRFNWTDHGYEFLKICEEKCWKIFFVGSTNDTLKRAVREIKRKFPGLQLVGWLNGFEDLNSGRLIEKINRKNPDILYVGLGTPKQEKWIHANADKINCRVIQSVGDLFSLFAGQKVRGPEFFRRLGFEWFFRFAGNPKKYFRRYAVGIPMFIIIIIREYFRQKSV